MTSKEFDLISANQPQSFSKNEVNRLGAIVSHQLKISASSLMEISPVAFAYIGDAVYELFVRCHYLFPPRKIADYHQQVVQQVRAETQAYHLQNLYPFLTDIEKNWVRRGRNSVNKSPRRLPRQTYQQATGLETLLGYLYIANPERLEFLLTKIDVTYRQK